MRKIFIIFILFSNISFSQSLYPWTEIELVDNNGNANYYHLFTYGTQDLSNTRLHQNLHNNIVDGLSVATDAQGTNLLNPKIQSELFTIHDAVINAYNKLYFQQEGFFSSALGEWISAEDIEEWTYVDENNNNIHLMLPTAFVEDPLLHDWFYAQIWADWSPSSGMRRMEVRKKVYKEIFLAMASPVYGNNDQFFKLENSFDNEFGDIFEEVIDDTYQYINTYGDLHFALKSFISAYEYDLINSGASAVHIGRITNFKVKIQNYSVPNAVSVVGWAKDIYKRAMKAYIINLYSGAKGIERITLLENIISENWLPGSPFHDPVIPDAIQEAKIEYIDWMNDWWDDAFEDLITDPTIWLSTISMLNTCTHFITKVVQSFTIHGTQAAAWAVAVPLFALEFSVNQYKYIQEQKSLLRHVTISATLFKLLQSFANTNNIINEQKLKEQLLAFDLIRNAAYYHYINFGERLDNNWLQDIFSQLMIWITGGNWNTLEEFKTYILGQGNIVLDNYRYNHAYYWDIYEEIPWISSLYQYNTEGLLSEGLVSPNQGTQQESFQFSVKYIHPLNQPPDNPIEVVVDGQSISMTAQGSNWSQGVEYTYTSSAGEFTIGTHQFYFEGQQGNTNLRYPATGELPFIVGPTTGSLSLTMLNQACVGDDVWITAFTDPPEQGITINFSSSNPSVGSLNIINGGITNANGFANAELNTTNAGITSITATAPGFGYATQQLEVIDCGTTGYVTMYADYKNGDETYSEYEIYFEVDDPNLQNVNYTFTTNNGYWLGSGSQTINFLDNYQGMEVLHIEQQVNTLITLTFLGNSYYYSFVPVLIPGTVISYFYEYQTTNVQNSWGFDWNSNGDKLYFSNYKDLGIIQAGTWQMSTAATNLFSSQLRDIIFSNSGNYIATSSSSKSYKINSTTYQIVAQSSNTYDFSKDTFIGWTNDDSKIIVCTESTDNVVFNSSLGFLSYLNNINDDIHDIAFKPNSNLCAVATEDYIEVNIYNCSGSNWYLVHQIDVGGSNEEVNGVCYNLDGSLLFVSDSEANLVRVYNANNYSEVTTLTVPEWPVQCRWNPDPTKDILAIGCKFDGKIYFFNSDYTLHSIAALPGQRIFRINWSPDGNVLAASIYGSTSLFLISPFDILAPTISLTNPPEPYFQTSAASFEVLGNIYDENSVLNARINIPNIGWENLTLNPLGNFQHQVPFVTGINDFTIEATDIYNQVSTYDFQIEKLPASLMAAFTANITYGFAPFEVQFVDLSEEIGTTITSWAWDFGDGNTSNDQHPLHTYLSHGVYAVSLTVTDGILTDTEIKNDYITVYYVNTMSVNFSGNPTLLLPGQTVNFVDLSSGNISEWNWSFEGGYPPTFATTVQGMNPPPIAYNNSGIWDVSLVITDGISTITEVKQEYIEVSLQLDLNVFLEGPFNGSTMDNYLNIGGYIPQYQPYNTSPWNYSGTESVTSVPNNDIVDWILVELRETPGGPETADSSTIITRKAGFLLSDGSVTDIDGYSPLTISGIFVQDNLYAVIWHRNHLAVMSNYPLVETGGIYSYVFHDSMDKVFGGALGHKEINGTWMMISGDGNADMMTNNLDKIDIWKPQAGNSGYNSGDFDVNGQVDNSDKIEKWMPNAGMGSQVPIYAPNNAPTAVFTVSPLNGTPTTIFNFDASGSYDPEDPPSLLEVRWDWENDGTWDTPYTTIKTATHQYSQPGNYTIKLEVKDTGGLFDYESHTIQVVINLPPTVPGDPAPANNSTNQPINPTLSWTCTDPENGPLTYSVYLGTSNPPSLAASNQPAPTYNPATLNNNTVYYWKIVAKDNQNDSTTGPVWNFSTLPQPSWNCGQTLTLTHNVGNVAPVAKTVNYGTVETNLTGSNKCWITQNLGADHQAISATDATEESAGWYWQFNRKQGYKHNGTTRTPNTTWVAPIDENSDWLPENDPCTLLLGSGWRVPTKMEWLNAKDNGGWNNYNDTYASVLKIHAAGDLKPDDGALEYRGFGGDYWSSNQHSNTHSAHLGFNDITLLIGNNPKSYGFNVRCLKDIQTSWSCGQPLPVYHSAGDVAPVNKVVDYGTVESTLTGSNKCWITQNLGADQQATSATDATEESAGWYWQFNRKQGYKHDGTTRTPNTTWNPINENSDWLPENDPCAQLFGSGWRVPTYTEWHSADANGSWNNYNDVYNSVLKLHTAGYLDYSDGSLGYRGVSGNYWASTQHSNTDGWYLTFNSSSSIMGLPDKSYGLSIRCLKDILTAWNCGQPLPVYHSVNDVAPVNKAVDYGTVETILTGTNQCWITQNLGADHQATSATDPTEESAGWYWQFNRKQGYMHDGSTRIPSTAWNNNINEDKDWEASNDPCTISLGSGWRLPTKTEWQAADANGEWNNYNDTYASVLKIHAAGDLKPDDGALEYRGFGGDYWSSNQHSNTHSVHLGFNDITLQIGNNPKSYGFNVRCLKVLVRTED